MVRLAGRESNKLTKKKKRKKQQRNSINFSFLSRRKTKKKNWKWFINKTYVAAIGNSVSRTDKNSWSAAFMIVFRNCLSCSRSVYLSLYLVLYLYLHDSRLIGSSLSSPNVCSRLCSVSNAAAIVYMLIYFINCYR